MTRWLPRACLVLLAAPCALAQTPPPASAPPKPEASAPPAAPGPRRALALAYDESRDRLILCGGGDAAGAPAPTWSFDGSAWTALDAQGPCERRGAVAAFDAKRGRVLLYGGLQGDDPTAPVFDELWSWDGKTWSKTAGATPGPRIHPAAAYDRRRERFVVAGGMQPGTGATLADVWDWDGRAWKQLLVAAPEGLFAPQMAFDEKAGTLVLTSSRVSDHRLATWSFDGATFRQLDADGPALILSGQSLVTRGAAGGVLLFGGFGDGKPVADTWTWDGKHWSRLDVAGPPARLSEALAFDRKRNRILLYGGEDGTTTFDDLWEFAGGAWKRLVPEASR